MRRFRPFPSARVLAIASLAVSAAASPALAGYDQPCQRSCPRGTVPVALDLRAKPASDDNGFLNPTAARKFYSSAMGKEDLDGLASAADLLGPGAEERLMNVASVSELRQRLIEVSNAVDSAGRCLRVKFLGVYSHGGLGYVSFPQGGLDLSTISAGVLDGLDCAMADDARVFFGGCNVARGCRGDDLLLGVAQKLLSRGGGRVRGFTNYAVTFAGRTTPRSIAPSNNTQFLTVGPGLANPVWDDGNGDGRSDNRRDCLGRIDDAKSHLAMMRTGMQACLRPNDWIDTAQYPAFETRTREGLGAVDRALAAMDQALAAESGRSPDRTRLDPSQIQAGRTFYEAFNFYYDVVDHYGDISCLSCHGECHQQSSTTPNLNLSSPRCVLPPLRPLDPNNLTADQISDLTRFMNSVSQ